MNEDKQSNSVVFDDIIPLTLRVSLVILLGSYLWYGAVYICYSIFNINVLQLVSLSYGKHSYPNIGHEVPNTGEFASNPPAAIEENGILLGGIYKSIRRLTVFNFCAFVALHSLSALFSISTNDSGKIETLIHHFLPLCILCFTSYNLFYASPKSQGQVRVKTSFKRIVLGGINSATMRTNDILLSDSMVSYAKVLNDVGLVLWKTFVPNDIPYSSLVELIMLAYPSVVRIKQCYYEYFITGQRQHFLNLTKYATGLAPIFVNFLIKSYLNELTSEKDTSTENSVLVSLNRSNNWWYFFSIISSTYSFVWDVKMDWGLNLFDYLLGTNPVIAPLRPKSQLIYQRSAVYYAAIVIDFLLRFVWVLKFFVMKETEGVEHTYLTALSTFLFGYDSYTLGYFLTEILEILRRWIWVFLKLESDLIKSQHAEAESSIELDALNKSG